MPPLCPPHLSLTPLISLTPSSSSNPRRPWPPRWRRPWPPRRRRRRRRRRPLPPHRLHHRLLRLVPRARPRLCPPPSSPAPVFARSALSFSGYLVELERGGGGSGGGGGGGGGGADPSGPLVSVDNLRAYLQIINNASILGLDHDIADHAFELFRERVKRERMEIGRLLKERRSLIIHHSGDSTRDHRQ
ncbi:uncharacterized protein LOC109712361 isoform X1 [Ananas comosus]|uniref:Uncharacterized protein LOC109712361 isoform X1 n=1 Tax=Ananas comosus TaxID=4615 RepID=A0A6P5F790_ANACO|nr:uncharacterized protein LOC109712361 isoform X1 [Ananas comosus]